MSRLGIADSEWRQLSTAQEHHPHLTLSATIYKPDECTASSYSPNRRTMYYYIKHSSHLALCEVPLVKDLCTGLIHSSLLSLGRTLIWTHRPTTWQIHTTALPRSAPTGVVEAY